MAGVDVQPLRDGESAAGARDIRSSEYAVRGDPNPKMPIKIPAMKNTASILPMAAAATEVPGAVATNNEARAQQ